MNFLVIVGKLPVRENSFTQFNQNTSILLTEKIFKPNLLSLLQRV